LKIWRSHIKKKLDEEVERLKKLNLTISQDGADSLEKEKRNLSSVKAMMKDNEDRFKNTLHQQSTEYEGQITGYMRLYEVI